MFSVKFFKLEELAEGEGGHHAWLGEQVELRQEIKRGS